MGTSIDFNDPRYHAPVPQAAANASAKEAADLQAKYLQAQREAEELRRLRNTPLPQAPKTAAQQATEAYQTKRATVLGEGAAKAEAGLPRGEQAAATALSQLNRLMALPGLEAAVGMPNPFRGGFGIGTVPGTSARDFTNALSKAKAGAFLQAIQQLRGTGAISEKEGDAATAALNNMTTATSENEFRRNAQEYASVVQGGVKSQRKEARIGVSPYSYAELMAERERRRAAGGRK